MRAVLLQLDVDRRESFPRRVAAVCDRVVAHRGADLVVLPELWATGYFAFDAYEETAEPLAGPTVRALGEAARAASVHLHAGSVVERGPDGRLHNTSLLFGPDGELLHTYRKFHLLGYRSREAELLAPGDGVRARDTALGRAGLATCYDLRFPELFRALAGDGAELLIVPAAWPASRIEHWRLLVRARALENQAFLLACNAAGRQEGVEVGGTSMVVDPWGTVLAEAGGEAGTLTLDLDPAEVGRTRAAFPAFHDRRPVPAAGPGPASAPGDGPAPPPRQLAAADGPPPSRPDPTTPSQPLRNRP
ncbi:carbon-nitrogen family hydrolase [Streptomyces sp. JJ38]|uniref:carbon-nitrogen family hydrolase n=1 Tax=Streptomyces sp. JJ38 TaxID=2738128 RepID=UPI001C5A30B3|nr:carbon-nitrogen family hydrolase [Streptomyces sp. JJ38]MBW1595848.1 carbon-nitrogen family hydrolase [Streptomyces sp. JJ38]